MTPPVAEIVSPELVLVTPELRDEALRLLAPYEHDIFAEPARRPPARPQVGLREVAAYAGLAVARTLLFSLGIAMGFVALAVIAQLL